ncbi:MAG: transcription termination/antitermination protein NusG [Nitrospinota bacterium]
MSFISEEWYAVRTRSRHEQKVNAQLIGKSFEVFYPQIKVWSRRKDRKKKIFKPLFPGYLFVHCNLTNDNWLNILKTFGVANLLGYDDQKPSPVPDEQILSIKKVLDTDIPIVVHPYLQEGERVIVVDGPLKDVTGVFVGMNNKKGKLIIAVDLLNRSLETEIDSSAVEKF